MAYRKTHVKSTTRTGHQFSQVPKAEIPRSSFDRSFGYKTTLDSGYLVPFLVDEGMPGDTFTVNMTAIARLATPIFPIMDNLFMDTFYFAVPYRLVWDNWQKFNGEQTNPEDSTDFLIPQSETTAVTGEISESLADYMGIPTGIPDLKFNSLHMRAYNLIYNEWFRDENLQQSLPVPMGDGPDDITNFKLTRRGKRHDYFTSSLPFPQKGDSIELPLGSAAPIAADADWDDTAAVTNLLTIEDPQGNVHEMNVTQNSLLGSNIATGLAPMYADLSGATAATINQLRQAFQIQKMLERDARGGTRYTEIIKAHFGVTSPDSRLQRPEYLGGGSTPVIINPIAQTAPDPIEENSDVGDLGATGTAMVRNHGFTKSFTEHCLIIGMVSVRADLTYQQGLNRMYSRQTRFDYYWPALSHIGEQAVLNKEIFAQGSADPTADEAVFGYQERFAEYRYYPSQITGKFRSNDPETLDAWHLAQDFATLPVLGDLFIEENPPVDRVIAVPTEPHFLFDSYIKMRTARPMPLYGVPGLIDHF